MNTNLPLTPPSGSPQSASGAPPAIQPSTSCVGNLIKTVVFSIAAVIVCALAWGIVAYFTNKIFFWGAILIGVVVSLAAMSGFPRVNFGVAALMLIPSVALTLVAILLGDFIFYTLSAMRELQMGLLPAIQGIAEVFVELESGKEGVASMVFGGIGALVGFYNAARGGGR